MCGMKYVMWVTPPTSSLRSRVLQEEHRYGRTIALQITAIETALAASAMGGIMLPRTVRHRTMPLPATADSTSIRRKEHDSSGADATPQPRRLPVACRAVQLLCMVPIDTRGYRTMISLSTRPQSTNSRADHNRRQVGTCTSTSRSQPNPCQMGPSRLAVEPDRMSISGLRRCTQAHLA